MNIVSIAILTIAAVAVAGLLLGSIRVRGIGLGPAGVLFAGLIGGHFGAVIEPEIAEFAKEFGLVLFVFTIGLQLGPGIFRLWRKQGLLLNGLALAVVGQGLLLVVIAYWTLGISGSAAAGIFSGATTNTPSLGAAQEAAAGLAVDGQSGAQHLAAAYAVTYPGGIIGIIVCMLLLQRVFRIDVNAEVEHQQALDRVGQESIERRSVLVENGNLAGRRFGEIPGLEETGVRISRIQRHDETDVHPATDATKLATGDLIQVVGTAPGLDRFTPLIGRRSNADLMQQSGDAQFRRIVVTEPAMLNKPLRELMIDHLYHATVTRINRDGVEMSARGSSRFQFGDLAHVVGDEAALDRLSAALGNSVKSLNHTQFIPLFIGIAVGVAVGMIPISLPGVPFPIRLGLAGGPLIAAILFSIIGSIGKFVWYIPYSANLALRDLGLILFLATAGLGAGQTFFAAVTSLAGLTWLLTGIAVTVIPLLTMAFVARLIFKLNYLTICGVIAGSMTDPPALSFANSFAESEACSTAYAAVYPLTMILRIVAAQAIIYALA